MLLRTGKTRFDHTFAHMNIMPHGEMLPLMPLQQPLDSTSLRKYNQLDDDF